MSTLKGNVRRFLQSHSNRQGIAVLGFATNDVDLIYTRYRLLHPALISNFRSYNEGCTQVLEVYAYYAQDAKEVDDGTILRFVERKKEAVEQFCLLPGLEKVEAAFDRTSQAAYCDHWVSNVFNRMQFLSTLHDTLGFTPKVRPNFLSDFQYFETLLNYLAQYRLTLMLE